MPADEVCGPGCVGVHSWHTWFRRFRRCLHLRALVTSGLRTMWIPTKRIPDGSVDSNSIESEGHECPQTKSAEQVAWESTPGTRGSADSGCRRSTVAPRIAGCERSGRCASQHRRGFTPRRCARASKGDAPVPSGARTSASPVASALITETQSAPAQAAAPGCRPTMPCSRRSSASPRLRLPRSPSP